MSYYQIDYDDAQEAICYGCELVKCTHRSRFPIEHDGPDEYDCPLSFTPRLVFDADDMTLKCELRG
jgi:hypothetical protein